MAAYGEILMAAVSGPSRFVVTGPGFGAGEASEFLRRWRAAAAGRIRSGRTHWGWRIS
ncbi:MAG: hypothetical protein WBP81_39540 [Solirubrobacteraceae bacterium]